MVRFTADVDSPPAKLPVAKIKSEAPETEVMENVIRKHKSPRRRIRKLKVDKLSGEPHRITKNKSKTRCSIEMILLLTIAAALGYFSVKDVQFTSSKIKRCDRRLPELFIQQLQLDLQTQIFRQDIAVQNLTTMLKLHNGLTTISFVGGCGVGKSLTATTMSRAFTESHSHIYHWPMDQENNVKHVQALQEMILGIPSCHPTLLVVDNLSWQQKPYIDDLFRWLQMNSRLEEKNLVILFVFNLEEYGAGGENASPEQQTIGDLQETHLITFRSFLETDAMAYLNQMKDREPELANVDLEHMHLMVENAQVQLYGLKRLVNKFRHTYKRI